MNFNNEKRVQRFSIRKLTIGAASVLLSTVTFMSMGANSQVKAAEVQQSGAQQPATTQAQQKATITFTAHDVDSNKAIDIPDSVQTSASGKLHDYIDVSSISDGIQKALSNYNYTGVAVVDGTNSQLPGAFTKANSNVQLNFTHKKQIVKGTDEHADQVLDGSVKDQQGNVVYPDQLKKNKPVSVRIRRGDNLSDAESKEASYVRDANVDLVDKKVLNFNEFSLDQDAFKQEVNGNDFRIIGKDEKGNDVIEVTEQPAALSFKVTDEKGQTTDLTDSLNGWNGDSTDTDAVRAKIAEVKAELESKGYTDVAVNFTAPTFGFNGGSYVEFTAKAPTEAKLHFTAYDVTNDREIELPEEYQYVSGTIGDDAKQITKNAFDAITSWLRDEGYEPDVYPIPYTPDKFSADAQLNEVEFNFKKTTLPGHTNEARLHFTAYDVTNDHEIELPEEYQYVSGKIGDDAKQITKNAFDAITSWLRDEGYEPDVYPIPYTPDKFSADAQLNEVEFNFKKTTLPGHTNEARLHFTAYDVTNDHEIELPEEYQYVSGKIGDDAKQITKNAFDAITSWLRDEGYEPDAYPIPYTPDKFSADAQLNEVEFNFKKTSLPGHTPAKPTPAPEHHDGGSTVTPSTPSTPASDTTKSDDTKGSQSTSTDTDSSKSSQSEATDTNSSSDAKSNDNTVSSDAKSTDSEVKPSVLSTNTKSKVATIAARSQVVASNNKSLPQTGMETNASEALGLLALGLGSLAAFATKKKEF